PKPVRTEPIPQANCPREMRPAAEPTDPTPIRARNHSEGLRAGVGAGRRCGERTATGWLAGPTTADPSPGLGSANTRRRQKGVPFGGHTTEAEGAAAVAGRT